MIRTKMVRMNEPKMTRRDRSLTREEKVISNAKLGGFWYHPPLHCKCVIRAYNVRWADWVYCKHICKEQCDEYFEADKKYKKELKEAEEKKERILRELREEEEAKAKITREKKIKRKKKK